MNQFCTHLQVLIVNNRGLQSNVEKQKIRNQRYAKCSVVCIILFIILLSNTFLMLCLNFCFLQTYCTWKSIIKVTIVVGPVCFNSLGCTNKWVYTISMYAKAKRIIKHVRLQEQGKGGNFGHFCVNTKQMIVRNLLS